MIVRRGTEVSARAMILLLTDFGTTDPFVGVMKAVILTECPEAVVVDLTHGIPPQAVAVGAFWLERVLPWLPRGAVVLAVVDPGVGTARAGLVVEAGGRTFVGPDNGLLEPVTRGAPGRRAFRIDGGRLGLPEPSATFHGRDVFAPVAGRLAAGTLAAEGVGSELPALVVLAKHAFPGSASGAPAQGTEGTSVKTEGVVAAVDHFGNLLTTIDTGALTGLGLPDSLVVEVGGRLIPLRRTYGEASPGEVIAIPSSWGVLEIAVSGGNASVTLGVSRGARVALRAARQGPAC